VFMLIAPDAFEAGFTAWVGSLADRFEREVVAIVARQPGWPVSDTNGWPVGRVESRA
jgi:hypothetical protein